MASSSNKDTLYVPAVVRAKLIADYGEEFVKNFIKDIPEPIPLQSENAINAPAPPTENLTESATTQNPQLENTNPKSPSESESQHQTALPVPDSETDRAPAEVKKEKETVTEVVADLNKSGEQEKETEKEALERIELDFTEEMLESFQGGEKAKNLQQRQEEEEVQGEEDTEKVANQEVAEKVDDSEVEMDVADSPKVADKGKSTANEEEEELSEGNLSDSEIKVSERRSKKKHDVVRELFDDVDDIEVAGSTTRPKTWKAKLLANAMVKTPKGRKYSMAASEGGESSILGRVTRSQITKRGRSPTSEAKTKTSGKKKNVEDREVDNRGFTKNLVWDTRFLQENRLGQVEEWIQSQGWEKLLDVENLFNEKNVKRFYEKLVIEDSGNMTVGHYFVKGQKFTFTLANILNIPSKGFAKYYRGQWLEDADSIELIKFVTDNDDPLSGPIPVNKMGGAKKVFFNYLINNILPREQKRHTIYIQEILVMDKILRGEKVCLPRLIMLHMDNVVESKSHALPYGELIISIMLEHKSYEKIGHATTPEARKLTKDMPRKFGLTLVNGEWVPKAEVANKVKDKECPRSDMESATLLGEIETLKKQNLEMGNMLGRLLKKVDELTSKVDDIAEIVNNFG